MVRMMRTPWPTRRSTAARGDLGEELVHHLRLHREDDDGRLDGRAPVVGRGADAVALLELGETFLAAVGEEDLARRGDPGAQQSLHEGLGHVAGAEEGDGLSKWHGRHSSR
jgi:hypothetical protein